MSPEEQNEVLQIRARLEEDPLRTTYTVLQDALLYQAARSWCREAPRQVFRALEKCYPFSLRIIGYGIYLLGGAEGDPEAAWEPFGMWVLTTRAGWKRFRGFLPLSLRQEQQVRRLERWRVPPFSRFRVLSYLIQLPEHRELVELVRMAQKYGNRWVRFWARRVPIENLPYPAITKNPPFTTPWS